MGKRPMRVKKHREPPAKTHYTATCRCANCGTIHKDLEVNVGSPLNRTPCSNCMCEECLELEEVKDGK